MKSLLRLILWPTILTLVINVLRLVLQVQGAMATRTGGSASPLGVTWLGFVFGGWFGWRLQKTGHRPMLPWSVLWAVVLLGAMVFAVVNGFGGIDRTDQSAAGYAALREVIAGIVLVSLAAAALSFVVWPRLALALLLYAIPVRLTVLAFTYLAKVQDWDTHYTKFGPAGIELDLGETMYAASVAQLGFWVPFTVVTGMVTGTIVSFFAGRRSDRA